MINVQDTSYVRNEDLFMEPGSFNLCDSNAIKHESANNCEYMTGNYSCDSVQKGDKETLKISPIPNSCNAASKTVGSVDRHLTSDLNVSAHTGDTIFDPKNDLMNARLKKLIKPQDRCSEALNICNELAYSTNENKDVIESSQNNCSSFICHDEYYNSVPMHCLSNDYSYQNNCEQVVLNKSDHYQNSEDVSSEVPMYDALMMAFGFEDEINATGFYNEVQDNSHLVHTMSKIPNNGTIFTEFEYCNKVEDEPVIEDLLTSRELETMKRVDLKEYFSQNEIIEKNNVKSHGGNALEEKLAEDLKSAELKKSSSKDIEVIELECTKHAKFEGIPLTKELQTKKIVMLKDNNKSKKKKDLATSVNLENCKKQKLPQQKEVNKDISKPKKVKREDLVIAYLKEREIIMRKWQEKSEKQKLKNQKSSNMSFSTRKNSLKKKDNVKEPSNVNLDKAEKVEEKILVEPKSLLVIDEGGSSKSRYRKKRGDLVVKCSNSRQDQKQGEGDGIKKLNVNETSSDTSFSFTTKISEPALKKQKTSRCKKSQCHKKTNCHKKSSLVSGNSKASNSTAKPEERPLVNGRDKDGKIRMRGNDRFRFLQPADAFKCASQKEYKKFEIRRGIELARKLGKLTRTIISHARTGTLKDYHVTEVFITLMMMRPTTKVFLYAPDFHLLLMRMQNSRSFTFPMALTAQEICEYVHLLAYDDTEYLSKYFTEIMDEMYKISHSVTKIQK